jgi:hypothetical protein
VLAAGCDFDDDPSSAAASPNREARARDEEGTDALDNDWVDNGWRSPSLAGGAMKNEPRECAGVAKTAFLRQDAPRRYLPARNRDAEV